MQGSRRLYRSRTDRMVSGVAGGMASYFDVDPTLVRLLWLVVGFTTGVGFVAYIVAAIVVPEGSVEAGDGRDVASQVVPAEVRDSPGADEPKASSGRARGGDRRLFGGALVVVGAMLLVQNYWRWADMERVFWPAVLILAGIGMFARGLGGDR